MKCQLINVNQPSIFALIAATQTPASMLKISSQNSRHLDFTPAHLPRFLPAGATKALNSQIQHSFASFANTCSQLSLACRLLIVIQHTIFALTADHLALD
jgi:hypothetical protein